MKTFPVLDATATGARIRQLRKENKLTVEQVRDFLGLESVQAIYKWQRGESLPSIDNLYALSTLFETSVDSILRGNREEDERSSSFELWKNIERISCILYNKYIIYTKENERCLRL